jgi:hypothetical protein
MAESGTGTKSSPRKDRASKGRSAGPATDGRAERDTENESESAAAPASAPSHVCSVAFCPIGMALTSIQGAGPEVLDHLLAAAREFLLAARAVIDARAADFEGGARAGGLEKIEIG